MSVRDDLAAAVTLTITLDGQDIQITGHAVQPGTIGPWDAWAVWQQTQWVNNCVREHTYAASSSLCRPPTVDTFVPAADEVVEAVGTALYAKGYWPGLSTLVQVLIGPEQPMPAVQIAVTV